MERFWNKVDKSKDCWEWTATLRNGYGAFKVDGKIVSSHRFSWEEYNDKKIPEGMIICHKCDNKKCVNPSHLFLGTYKDNTQDAISKGRHFMKGMDYGSKFKDGHKPKNSLLKTDEEVRSVKQAIKDRDCSLRVLSERLNLPYQLLRDINAEKVHKNI